MTTKLALREVDRVLVVVLFAHEDGETGAGRPEEGAQGQGLEAPGQVLGLVDGDGARGIDGAGDAAAVVASARPDREPAADE